MGGPYAKISGESLHGHMPRAFVGPTYQVPRVALSLLRTEKDPEGSFAVSATGFEAAPISVRFSAVGINLASVQIDRHLLARLEFARAGKVEQSIRFRPIDYRPFDDATDKLRRCIRTHSIRPIFVRMDNRRIFEDDVTMIGPNRQFGVGNDFLGHDDLLSTWLQNQPHDQDVYDYESRNAYNCSGNDIFHVSVPGQ